jgi:hypothetical protein
MNPDLRAVHRPAGRSMAKRDSALRKDSALLIGLGASRRTGAITDNDQ